MSKCEIDRQAIVDQLPKTADGVPIAPGDLAWFCWPSVRHVRVESVREEFILAVTVDAGLSFRAAPDSLFSTHEAATRALAAAE